MTELNIGALTDSTSYTGSVDTTNIFDIYKFNINSPGNFQLSIDGLSGNADVFLLNSTGATLYSSTNAGTDAETISVDSLLAGDYSVKILQITGDIKYTLNLAPTSTQQSSDADTLTGATSDSPLPSNSAATSEKPTANKDVITGTAVDDKTVTAEITSTTTEKPVTTDSETTLTSEPKKPVAAIESAVEPTSTTTEKPVTIASETTLTSEPEKPLAATESAVEPTSTTTEKPVTTASEITLTPEPEKPVTATELASEKLPSEETTSAGEIAPDKPTDSAISTAEEPSGIAATNNPNSTVAAKTDAVAGETIATQQPKTGETLIATSPDASKPGDEKNTDTSNGEETKKENSTTTVATTETKKEPEPTTDKKLISPFTSGVFTTDETGRISVDYTFDGGMFQGELAIFSLDDLDKFEPGSEAFIKEVAARSLSNSVKGHVVIDDATEGARFAGLLGESNANEGVYLGVKSFAVTAGGKYGVMLIPNGSVKSVFDNPTVGGDRRPLFSMAMANPVEGFHFGQIADVTGEGNTFVMEDMRLDSGTDRDYNDIIFQVRGATGRAALLDTVINPDKDWRKTDLGKAVIAYAKPYITPEPKPTVDAELSDLLDDLETEILNPSTSDKETPKTPAPVANADTNTTDATKVVSTDKVDAKPTTPAVTTEEEVKDTANNSSDLTQVETTDKVDTKPTIPAVTTEEEVKDTANNSGDSTQVETTDKVDTNPTTGATTPTAGKDTVADSTENLPVEKTPVPPATTEVKDRVTETPATPTLPAKSTTETEVAATIPTEKVETKPEVLPAESQAKVETKPEVLPAETLTKVETKPEVLPAETKAKEESKQALVTEVEKTETPQVVVAANPIESVKESQPTVAVESKETPAVVPPLAAETVPVVGTNIAVESQKKEIVTQTETAGVNDAAPKELLPISPTVAKPTEDNSTPAVTQPVNDEVAHNNNNVNADWIARLESIKQRLSNLGGADVVAENAIDRTLIARLEAMTEKLREQTGSTPISDNTGALISRLEDMVVKVEPKPVEPIQTVQFEFPVANQPLVGVIDTGFSGNNPDIDYSRIILGRDRVSNDFNPLLVTGEGNEHGTHILGIIGATQNNGVGIDGVNDKAPLWVGRAIGSGQWAESLVEFVNAAIESNQPNAVVNLSLDLTQINPDGSVTTRYEFTPEERAAIEYARQHNVLLVVAAGNDGGVMSVLGQASQEFDNIITVGAAERINDEIALSKAYDRSDYSSYGAGLDILADGGTVENPVLSTTGDGVGAMAGTSVATAKVTGAVSQVWAANPQLSYRQVIQIIKDTATDLKEPNWDEETGAGLLNMAAALTLAKATQPELLPVEPPKDDEPEVQEPVIKITPEMGFLPEPIKLTDDIWFLGGPSPDKLNLIGGFSNRNAADTTNADQLWSGGGLGLNLNGSGVTVGVWDEAKVRNTHQEFGSRVAISDAASNFSDHATHVAGTIGATGVNSEARGMANQVNIRSYDWNNDLQELEAAAKTGLTLSNHSYGSIIGWDSRPDWSGIGVYGKIDSWFGDRSRFSEAEGFGKYGQDSKELDQLLQNNPNLLSIWAAGNDRGGAFGNIAKNNTYVTYFSSNPGNIPNWQGQGWYKIPNSGVTNAPGKDGGNTGYDTLSAKGAIAKNTLVVGAINAITADPYNSSNVVMSSFSNWGPTDDGRLKVDVVGNGVGVYSTLASSNTAYASYSGTSMATPNVTGTATLLTQHYKNLYGTSPRSATLKGVITHTAFDAGNKGPDYTYGWGVVDGAAAATFLTNAKNQVTDRLIENTYTGSQQSYQITSNGSGSLKATLVWTDPPGTPHGNGLDEKTRVLVNDLDLSITAPNGQVFRPWTLDPNNPSAPAVRTTRNNVDNIEQVLIDAPMAGTYTINVNHSGNSFTQAYSLLVSGISKPLENPIGRGSRAPNLFIDAYNRVNGQGRGLKAQGDAYRWGNGWTQRFLDSNNNEVLIMLEDGQSQAYVVWGEILKEYKNVGGPVGANLPGGGWAYLGYPRSDEKGGTSSKGSPLALQEFAGENGKARLYYHWNNGNRVATWGSVGAYYINIGGHNHWLGAPIKREYIDGDTIFADFEGGRIAFRTTDAKTETLQPGQQPSWRQTPKWQLDIENEYQQTKGLLGNPRNNTYFNAGTTSAAPAGTTGIGKDYEWGSIHWSQKYGAVALWRDLQREYEQYSSPNGSGGWLGFPTRREYDWNGGKRTDFEGGYIYWNGQRAKAYRLGELP
ncbi:S8 family serine peptidase [Microcoleus sp. N3A4]|uniref:S8 family serine peptidase n=1 Tax=Microcoleus sp. N3A4 TaxID=3055379 RepID=UPI002FD7293B